MTRRQKDPLRALTEEERELLVRISRSYAEPASHVARAKALLAVADGMSYTAAAKTAGRRSGDAVSHLVSHFNREGLAALQPGHGAVGSPLTRPPIAFGYWPRRAGNPTGKRMELPPGRFRPCVELCAGSRTECPW
jgi:hypothetical protein